MKFIKINNNNYPHLKIDYISNTNNNIITFYENEEVVLFFTTLINSFGHSIIVGYHILYNYLTNNLKSKILLPNISENHYYYQFINIFIPKEKIILIEYDKIYSFKNIIDYKIKPNIQLLGIKKNDFEKLNFINQLLVNKISLLNKKNIKQYSFTEMKNHLYLKKIEFFIIMRNV